MGMIEINRNPSPRQLRQFAGIGLPLLCGVLGAVLYWKFGLPAVALSVWGGGVVVGLIGLLRPSLIRPVFIACMYAALPPGWLLSHLILTLLYYLVFTPVGLWLRLVRGDPMARRADKAAETYWQPREPAATIERYFKQY